MNSTDRFAAESLFPTAQELIVDGGLIDFLDVTIESGTSADSAAWRELDDLNPALLPAEGYALRVRGTPDGVRVVLAATDEAGLRWGLGRLAALAGHPVPEVSVRDWPVLPWRGLIEGFYGTPWSDDDRLGFFAFAERNRLNVYVYAPKDDPLHRERWRELYDAAGLARLARLVSAAAGHGVRFVYAIHPAMSMRYSDEDDHLALIARAEQLWKVGVRSFALLFDDVEYALSEADAAIFGGTGSAHGATCARFARDFIAVHPDAGPLLIVPTDYAGNQRSEYRDQLAAALPPSVVVWWTGSDVVVGEVSRADIDEAAEAFGRPLLLWDNYPVNDFDFSRLFLGPLQGRTSDVVGAPLLGITANPMVEATASRFALAAVAEWAWNPGGYDPAAASARALAQVADHSLAAFVAAQNSWPPSAAQSVEWESAMAAASSGAVESSAELAELCHRLAATPVPAGRLGQELEPWIDAARLVAAAILAALDPTSTACHLQQFARSIEAAPANVLRPIALGFLASAIAQRN